MQKNAVTATVATLVMGIFGAFLRWLQNTNLYDSDTGLAAPRAPISFAFLLFSLVMFAVMAIGGIGLMFSAGASEAPVLQRLLGAAAIVAGAAFPFLPGRILGGTNPLSKPASLILPLFYCVWLVFIYRSNLDNPVLWAYAPEVFAVVATILAFFYIAGCFYGRKTCNAALIAAQIAVYLDLSVLSDELRTLLKAMLIATALMLLLLEYMMISNLTKSSDT